MTDIDLINDIIIITLIIIIILFNNFSIDTSSKDSISVSPVFLINGGRTDGQEWRTDRNRFTPSKRFTESLKHILHSYRTHHCDNIGQEDELN